MTAALAVGMTLSAQAPAPPQTPVFRAEVAAVTVDVRVVDKDGAFVRDLSADDFIVYEDDVPQPITAFTDRRTSARRSVSLGSIALQTNADRTMVTRGSIQPWQQRSDLVPTARRQFAATETVSMYTEVYSNKGRAGDSITATMLVQQESGDVLFRQERMFAAERGNEKWLTHPLTLPLPVSDLPPGRYVLSVRAVNSADVKHPVQQNVAFTMHR